ncbi:MAG: serine/threonine protein phosphatase, partial [Proteobacteria bacterium]
MLPEIPKDSIIAVGDIHGCDVALERLLSLLIDLPNRVVFLGDYVDRGACSPRVIGLLIMAQLRRPDWVFLVGNHEVMLMEDVRLNLPPFGDDSGYEQYVAIGGLPATHMRFIEGLEIFWESESFLFVHGGIEGEIDKPVAEHTLDELTWSYTIHKGWAGKRIVRGHFVVREPEQHSNHINLDTGCVFEGWLSAGVLDDRTGDLKGSIQVDIGGIGVR